MEVERQSGGRKKGRGGGRERSVNMIMYYKSILYVHVFLTVLSLKD